MTNNEELIGTGLKIKINLKRLFFPKTSRFDGGFGIGVFYIREIIEGKIPRDIEYTKEITIKGNMPSLDYNETYICDGTWVEDGTWGLQIDCVSMRTDYKMENQDDQKTFLKLILAESIVDSLYTFYQDPIELIKNEEIDKLSKIKGIGTKKALRIIKKYNENLDNSEAYIELTPFEIPKSSIDILIHKFHSPSILLEKIKNNPYILMDEVSGYGWKKSDAFAMKMGIPKNSFLRVCAFTKYFFTEVAEQEGHSWVGMNILLNNIQQECDLSDEDIYLFVKAMMGRSDDENYSELKENPILYYDDETQRISSVKYFTLEKNIADNMLRLNTSPPTRELDEEIIKNVLEAVEKDQGFDYTEQQKEAIEKSLRNQVSILTGFPGTGKTYSIRGIVEVLKAHGYSIAQVALSGRAASKLTEVTHIQGQTIHRLLGYTPTGSFTFNNSHKLPFNAIIVDETSMIGGDLFYSLIQAIESGAKLILVGDTHQLEAIGNCNILKDCIQSGIIATSNLTKIHRQAEKSGIITNSIKACMGEQIFSPTFIGTEIKGELQDFKLNIYNDKILTPSKIMEEFKELYLQKHIPAEDIQVLLPLKSRGESSCRALNLQIQALVNPLNPLKKTAVVNYPDKFSYTFSEGDRIIVTTNCYKTLSPEGEITPIFNGNIGTIDSIFEEGMIVDLIEQGKVLIPTPLFPIIQLGYAITVHKKQGDSSPYIIFGLDAYAYALMSKELVYTAITRARKYCVVVAQNSTYQKAITISRVKKKQTWLTELLMCRTNVIKGEKDGKENE